MAATKTKEPKIKTTKESHLLKCELTQEEVLAAGDALATAIDNVHKLQDEKESVVKSIKAREAVLEAEITKQQLLVRNKYDFRHVDCNNILDYEALECYVIRLDTKVEVSHRKMTEEEKQTTLPFDGEEVAA